MGQEKLASCDFWINKATKFCPRVYTYRLKAREITTDKLLLCNCSFHNISVEVDGISPFHCLVVYCLLSQDNSQYPIILTGMLEMTGLCLRRGRKDASVKSLVYVKYSLPQQRHRRLLCNILYGQGGPKHMEDVYHKITTRNWPQGRPFLGKGLSWKLYKIPACHWLPVAALWIPLGWFTNKRHQSVQRTCWRNCEVMWHYRTKVVVVVNYVFFFSPLHQTIAHPVIRELRGLTCFLLFLHQFWQEVITGNLFRHGTCVCAEKKNAH